MLDVVLLMCMWTENDSKIVPSLTPLINPCNILMTIMCSVCGFLPYDI